MDLLLDIAPSIPPVLPEVTGAEVYRRFEAEPDTLAIAVVDAGGRPVGIVERNAFLVKMAAQYGYALWSGRPIAQSMKTDPVIADGDVTVAEFCGRILQESSSDLLHGFIVTREGRYVGVGAALNLLQASAAATARHAVEMSRMADEARDALAAKERFLAVMSHEIRTPLNGVLGVAEIIRRKLRQDDLRPLVDTILDSGGVLLRLLNDALDLSRAQASGLELDEEPMAVVEVLDQVRALWSPQAELKGVALRSSYDGPSDLCVLGDMVRIRQIFNNLVGNALKFTPGGEVIVTLRTCDDGGFVRLLGAVRDNGPGVPADRLDTIFEPFSQTEEGVRRGGAGLGLAVCRQITARMGGTIGARNHEAGGAVFEFDIPLHRLPSQSGEAASGDEASTDGALHVLIVDDNATNRLVAENLCEIFGCTTESVADGSAAIEAALSGRFDLVLMDIKMPGMDGVEATRRIRSGPHASSQVPVVALTANADPSDAAFYQSCGMNGVVEKPIRPERLLAAITAVFHTEETFPAHTVAA